MSNAAPAAPAAAPINLAQYGTVYPVILISKETGTIRSIQAAWDGQNWRYQGKFNKIAQVNNEEGLIFQNFQDAKNALVAHLAAKLEKEKKKLANLEKIYAAAYHCQGPRNG